MPAPTRSSASEASAPARDLEASPGSDEADAPLDCRREDFQIPRDEHYLNCAYMGPLPRVAEEAGFEAIRKKRVPTRIAAPDDFWATDRLRVLFARLIGSEEPQRVAIQPGVSYGVATAARNLRVDRGQNVVVTHEQFPGNYYAWERLAGTSGGELRVAAPPEGGQRGRGWNERLLESIDARTTVVAVPVVHWTDGTRFDLVEVGRRCRDVGAALVVDATQSVGALPFDVEQVGADVVLCANYKWLLGPYSLSFGWYGPRFADGTPLEETWIGRAGSRDFQSLVHYQSAYQPGAVRYDVAERSNFFLAPIAEASLRLLLGWRPERIQAYCRFLTAELIAEARALGYSVEDEAWRGSHLFGLRMPSTVDLGALRDALSARRVSVSLRGTALRLSPNVYNDAEDVGVLAEVLREVVG